MKKQWLIMGLLIMSVLAFTACGKKQEEAAKTVENAEEGGQRNDRQAGRNPGRVYRRDGSDRQLAG